MVMNSKLLLTGIALMVLTVMANAQNPGRANGQCNGAGKGSAYVDNNKNGVCDNYENRSKTAVSSKKGNSKGCCKGKKHNFVDANKNGVCDNKEVQNKK
jgi:hypothetical protein